jgi:endo-1,4-beta-xylanase
MVNILSLFVGALAITGAVAAPAVSTTDLIALDKRQSTPNNQGTHDGFFFSWWSDGGAAATYTNQAAGRYTVRWSNGGNLVGGKGWKPGVNARGIGYSGSYNYNGNSYLAIYGWMRNPLVEYYIVENFGTFDPSSGASNLGTVTCDGSTYRLGSSWRYNKPSIDGNRDFQQFWSVRVNKRTGGTVQTGCHFDAWKKAGLPLGNHDYQIVATEGYFSSGSADITVRDVGSG